jgi:hypothetical protein
LRRSGHRRYTRRDARAVGGLLEKPQIAGIEHLRVLIAKERKDRLALVAPLVANLGQREIQHARLLAGRSSTTSADSRPTVGEGSPDFIVVVNRDRVIDCSLPRRLPHAFDVALERELRRVDADDDEPVVSVRV